MTAADPENTAGNCERITVTLTPEAAKALAALCRPGHTKTGTVNRALLVLGFLEEQAGGIASVLVRAPDGTISEVMFL